MRRILTVSGLVAFSLLSGQCCANELGSSPWKELTFRNEDGDEVRISVDNKRHLIEKVAIKSALCKGEFADIEVPGIIDLNGVDYLNDEDGAGKFNVLTIRYLEPNDQTGTLSLTIRNCRLELREVY